MAKASAAHSSPMSAVPPHFILDESTKYKLDRVALALSGIATMATGQAADQEHDPIEIPRSQLGAIFDLLSDHVVELIENLPYMHGCEAPVSPDSYDHPLLCLARVCAKIFDEDGKGAKS
jgi:hypothetical protein